MKDDYIGALDRALKYHNVNNKDEVLEKFEKKYDFGLESGLSEEQIEKMLGNPTEIAKKLAKEEGTKEKYEFKKEGKKDFNLIVKTVSDDIVIEKSKDSEIHTYLEGIKDTDYELKNNSEIGVYMVYKTRLYLASNRKKGRKLYVEIPAGTRFDYIDISSACGTIEINTDLIADKISVGNQSGPTNITSTLKAKGELGVHTVSADFVAEELIGNWVHLSDVSGNCQINSINANSANFDTVTGNVKVGSCSAKIKTTSVSGDVLINGINYRNIKDRVKGMFKL